MPLIFRRIRRDLGESPSTPISRGANLVIGREVPETFFGNPSPAARRASTIAVKNTGRVTKSGALERQFSRALNGHIWSLLVPVTGARQNFGQRDHNRPKCVPVRLVPEPMRSARPTMGWQPWLMRT